MAEKCEVIMNIMEKIAPLYLAEPWDNVGLQIGDYNKSVQRVMVCLEVTPAVVDESIFKEVDLIISHHPLIFKPIKSITTNDPIGRMMIKLVKNDIAVYSAHTNLDSVSGGTNDILAQKINLMNVKPLKSADREKYYKIIVFVPKNHINHVRNAICDAGAGYIGKYSHCTFQIEGTGTFKPLEGTTPYIGTVGQLEKVSEFRLETIVSKENLNTAIKEMLQAHPYEEVAYDIIPLENDIHRYGLGRVGDLSHPMSLSMFANTIKSELGLSNIRVVGDINKKVQKIGLCAGSGAELIFDAYKMGCDCYITGDIKYHDAQYAIQLGMPVIDAGHFDTEQLVCTAIAEQLKKAVKHNNYVIDILLSDTYINPFHIL